MRYILSTLVFVFLIFSATHIIAQELLAAEPPVPVGFEIDAKKRLKEVWQIIPAAKKMVEDELKPQGKLENERVLSAVMRIPREKFVPPVHREMAYRDFALPIGNAQTISPPYIVTYMTEQLDPQPEDKVLEIGTGSGYQAAVLSLLVKEVYSIEIVEPLGKRAAQTLKKQGFKNVFTKVGDGYKGWPDAAPFDKIIVTCSPESVPQPLIDQLKEGGLMIVPVGQRYQQLFYLFTKKSGELEKQPLTPALFVPMTGEAESNRIVLPDSKNPSLVGGDFEENTDSGHPIGWHYSRNAKLISEETAPSGSNFIRFTLQAPAESETILSVTPNTTLMQNDRSGSLEKKGETSDSEALNLRAAQVIQGFAVDGRSVSKLQVEAMIRAEKVRSFYTAGNSSGVIQFVFYNDDRDAIGQIELAPVYGSFQWQQFSQEIKVPPQTREAIIYLGLFQKSGQLDMDNVTIKKVGK